MTALTDPFAQGLIDLVFLNIDLAEIGDGPGLQASAVAGNLFIGGHIAEPGPTATAITNEATFTGYSRGSTTRDGNGTTGWSRTGNSITNNGTITLGTRTAGAADVLTWLSIVAPSSGDGLMLAQAKLNTPWDTVTNPTPTFLAGELSFTFTSIVVSI